MELWHGPTWAFKDVALSSSATCSLLPRARNNAGTNEQLSGRRDVATLAGENRTAIAREA